MGGEDLFKTGLIVGDLERAARDLSDSLGLTWASVQIAELCLQIGDRRENVELPFVYSRSGPPYLELLQAQPSGYYAASQAGAIHHVGLWVDDLAEASARLAARGMPLEAAGVQDERCPALFAFHTNPHGLRLELVERANRTAFLEWIAGGSLDL